MRVAVTGGAGYIGSVVTEVLGADGHQVLVIDNLSKGHQDGVAGAFEQIDLRDRTAVAIALRGFRADAVIHMAASSLVGESVSGPLQWTPRHQALDTIVGSAWAWMKRADPAVAAVQGRQSS